MVPLLLKPILVDEVWGSMRLGSEFFELGEPERISTAYMLSELRGFKTFVKSGNYAGLSLRNAIKKMGVSALGQKAIDKKIIPLTIKLIDASEQMPVQVCPDDEYALSHDGVKSGDKLWYIVDADENSRLVYGFKYPTDTNEIADRLHNGSLSEICNTVVPKKGDVYLIKSGMVHTAARGVIIAEIRGESNLSYPLTEGKSSGARQKTLRTKDAMNVINTSPTAVYKDNSDLTLFPFGTVKTVVKTDEFTTELLCLNGNAGLCEDDCFMSLLVTSGEAVMSYVGGNMRIKKGDSVFLPANVRVIISGRADILCTKI